MTFDPLVLLARRVHAAGQGGVDVEAHHGLAEVLGHLGELLGILEVRGGLDNGFLQESTEESKLKRMSRKN